MRFRALVLVIAAACTSGPNAGDAGDAGDASDAGDVGDASPCGGVGEKCCPGDACIAGAFCAPESKIVIGGSDAVKSCVACGQSKQRCCPSLGCKTGDCVLDTCNGGGCCTTGGFRVPSAAYLFNSFCTSSGGTCAYVNGATCTNGSCGGCGGIGEPCCTGLPGATWAQENGGCTASGSRCVNGTCK